MWKNINLNSNLIKQETAKAFLIKIPKTKWLFWYPAKLVRFNGKGGYMMSIGFNSDMTFNIFQNGNGKYNRFEKIAQKTLNFDEMMAMLGVE